MFIRCLFFVSLLLLAGCNATQGSRPSSGQGEDNFEQREELLLRAGDNDKLIEFYKQSLRDTESPLVRIKLVKAYLDSKDYESAAFHVDQITTDESTEAEVAFLAARISYSRGDYKTAFEKVSRVLELTPEDAQAENLMGLLLAERGDLQQARVMLNRARMHFLEDATIKNNLAVLDMLQGKYQAALERLQSLYDKGMDDERVRANLVLVYAKLGQYSPMERLLKKQGYSAEQSQQTFIALRKAYSKKQGSPLNDVSAQEADELEQEADELEQKLDEPVQPERTALPAIEVEQSSEPTFEMAEQDVAEAQEVFAPDAVTEQETEGVISVENPERIESLDKLEQLTEDVDLEALLQQHFALNSGEES